MRIAKQGTSFEALAQRVETLADQRRDYVAPVGEVVMLPDASGLRLANAFQANDPDAGPFELNRLAQTQLAGRLDIPQKFYTRLRDNDPELLAVTVNRLRQPIRDKAWLLRTHEHTVDAVLSDTYRPLENRDVFKHVLPAALEAEAEVASCELTERRLYAKVTSPKLVGEIKAKDGTQTRTIEGGFMIRNSEVGESNIWLTFFAADFVCLNGMIVGDVLIDIKQKHRGKRLQAVEGYEYVTPETQEAENAAFWMRVRDAALAGLDPTRFQQHLERMQAAAESPKIKTVAETVARIGERFNLDEAEQGTVLNNLALDGDMSQLGLANALTATAKTTRDYDRASDFEAFGGQVITLDRSQWERLAA